MVMSRDEKTGRNVAAKVLQTFRRQTSQTLKLRFGSETIETTKEHPFFVKGRGFTPAKLLATGALVASLGGSPLALDAAQWSEQAKPVFNFEVEGTHTYFVGKSKVCKNQQKPGTQYLFSIITKIRDTILISTSKLGIMSLRKPVKTRDTIAISASK